MAKRIFKRHDTKITPRVRFLDEAKQPLDLTGCSVVYSLYDLSTETLKIDRAPATLEDQTAFRGQVFYQFQPEDVDTAGDYLEEWEATYPDGLKESRPLGSQQQVTIEEDLDNV